MKKVVMLCMYLASAHLLEGFATLESVRNFAATHPEFPVIKSNNLVLNPDYTSWYRAHAPNFFARLLDMVGIRKLDWSSKDFMTLLATQLKTREKAGYAKLHTLVMRPHPGTYFCILGPVFSSFHSLARDLTELQRQGFITNDFKIVKEHAYIVFDGNVIDGSPYGLETLTVVLALMNANPDNVIYLMGQHEYSDFWKGDGFETELEEKVADVRVESQLTKLFATLPCSLVLLSAGKKDNALRITNFPADSPLLQDGNCIDRLHTLAQGERMICPLAKKDVRHIPIVTLIEAEKRLVPYTHHPGMVLLPSENGATHWSIFSAPNELYREYFHFYFDAFILLTIGKTFDSSTLTLFNHDTRKPEVAFAKAVSYNAVSGRKILYQKEESLLKEKPPLYIGCTLDLTKGASNQGKAVKMGMAMRVDHENEKGGINGRRLEVVYMDDEYSPTKARANVEKFIKKYKSRLFLCNLGSPTLQAYLDLLKEGKIFIFFPATGAPLFRQPGLSLAHWMTSYQNEAKALTRYMIKEYGIKDFGFLYQNDVYGFGSLNGAREVLKAYNITKSKEVPYERNSTSFKTAIEAMKAASPSAIGFFSTAIAATEFIRQAGVEFFIGKKLFAVSDLAEEQFRVFARRKGLDIVTSLFVPNPETSMLEIVQEFRQGIIRSRFIQSRCI